MTNNINNKKQSRKKIGYLIMIIGILFPLYAFLNISYNNFVSLTKYTDFLYSNNNRTSEEKREMEDSVKNYTNKLKNNSNVIDPFGDGEYITDYNLPSNDPDLIFGYVSIPKISSYQPIRLGATIHHLDIGAAHVDGTSLPVGGVGTRSVIAGHRGLYKNLMFLNLNELEYGDEIKIETFFGEELIYKVTDKEIILPTEWQKVMPIANKDMLTLLTCEPVLPTANYRLLVNAERVLENQEVNNNVNKEIKIDKFIIIVYIITIILFIITLFLIFKLIKLLLKK